jgi:hypothetical protein
MNRLTIIQASVQIAIIRVAGVLLNLITLGIVIALRVIQMMHLQTTITDSVQIAILQQVGMAHHQLMMD